VTVLLDTCAAIWLLAGPVERLTDAARLALRSGPAGVPAVVVLEMGYLVQGGRLGSTVLDQLLFELGSDDGLLVPVALGVEAFRAAAQIPRSVSTDPFDRMVAGTALAAGLPLVTADSRLREVPGLTVIW